MRKLSKLLITVAAIVILLVFIADTFGGRDERKDADILAAQEGTISGEPFTVEPADEADGLRSYPDFKDAFAVPAYGVRAGLPRTKTPEAGLREDHAPSYSFAHLIGNEAHPTEDNGTVRIHINASDDLDALGNGLLNPDSREPVTEPGDLFIIDGVAYELTEAVRMKVEDLTEGTEPVIADENGRALVFAFLLNQGTQPSGEVVVFTLHRIGTE